MAKNGYRVGALAAITIVALRLIVGWHFLAAGLEKFEPGWTSAGFLRSANGPLEDFYKSMAPLPHEWDRLVVERWPNASEFEKDRTSDGYIPMPTEAYGPWASRIAQDWTDTVDRFKKIEEITEEQAAAADKLLKEKLNRLSQYFEERRALIAEYHHELHRLHEMIDESEEGTTDLPYLKKRIAKKEEEVGATPRAWVSDIEAEGHLLHDELRALVTDEQKKLATTTNQVASALNPPAGIKTIDQIVTWVTLGVGLLLILGLFTRVAAIVGAGFLFSVISMQPPWADGVLQTAKLLTAYQGIEIVCLLFLAAIGAGTWAGLDGVLFSRKDD